MAIKFLHDLDVQGNIDFNDNQALNAVLQHLSGDPTAEEGKIYYNSATHKIRACLGTTASDWTELSFGDITEVIGGTRIDVTGGTTGAATVNLDSATVSEITTNSGKTGLSASQISKLSYLTVTQDVDLDTMESDISTNNNKVTNVTTDLTVTGNTGDLTIVSSDGTDAILTVVSSAKSGIVTPTQLDTLESAAPNASPGLTGVPTAPTAASNTNTTQIATTAYVQTEITDLIGGAPGVLDTLNELAAAIDDDASYASTITTALGGKSPTAGNTSLTTVGTIGTGTWQGAAINQTYITGLSGDNTGDEPDANTTTKGIAERATDAESLAGTDTARFVTPKHLADRTYTTTIGGATSTAVTHNLGTKAVMVQLYDTDSFDTVHAKVVRNTTNQVTVSFRTAPSSGDITVVVTKIQ